jgi:hypothetical protein
MNSSHEYKSKFMSKGSLSNTIDSKYISSKNVVVKKNNKFIGIKDIKKYFEDKNIKYNLDSRIFYYNHILNKIAGISNNECLNVRHQENSNAVNYTIKDKISLVKRIGTSSKYGYIYIANIKNEIGKRPIAAKLMIQNNRNILESELNSKITELIINKKLSKHFILTYKVIKCNILSNKKLPDIINNRKYIILLNELARGDLKHLCKQKDFLNNDDMLYNVFVQIMLSILTFHNFGYVHRDCHWGNFLYHYNNNLTGYYHYNINGKNYYLKTGKYSMYIYDFGLCTTINRVDNYDIYDDYRRIMGPFVNQNISKDSWLADINMPMNLPSNEFSIFIRDFKYKLRNIYKDNRYISIQNTKFLNLISEGIISELLKLPNNIFTDTKPLNAKIINKKPYYINNKNKIINL